ncbi:hypothetical protein BKA70DRAFT_1424486 [Coprinopsis sp. MPI-PUGE-AT-0042]|nr:hypothetical protein BKA70DRAFT_1424486 [Coprinopsis sp. MPI-PUGE-AT-0042]
MRLASIAACKRTKRLLNNSEECSMTCVSTLPPSASFEGSVTGANEKLEKDIRDLTQRLKEDNEAWTRSIIDPWGFMGGLLGKARSSQEILKELHDIEDYLGEVSPIHDKIEHLIQVGLPIVHEEVGKISPGMKLLGEIWAYLRAQAQEAQLNLRQSMDGEMPDFMRPDTIKQMKIGYLKLYICVEQYASGLEPIFERDF